jgi:hypothetical protein
LSSTPFPSQTEGHPAVFLREQLPERVDVLAFDSAGDTKDDKILAFANSFNSASHIRFTRNWHGALQSKASATRKVLKMWKLADNLKRRFFEFSEIFESRDQIRPFHEGRATTDDPIKLVIQDELFLL